VKDWLVSKVWPWIRHYLVAPLPIILVVVGAIILVIFGAKNVQIGGILSRLTGRKQEGTRAVDAVNSISQHRITPDGLVIQPGLADEKGLTQAVVVPIEKPGIFSNPDQVTILNQDKKPIIIDLPTGVKARDVDKVLVLSPEIHVVTIKDSSPIQARDVDNLLNKYGKIR